jgi:hypothetical protein
LSALSAPCHQFKSPPSKKKASVKRESSGEDEQRELRRSQRTSKRVRGESVGGEATGAADDAAADSKQEFFRPLDLVKQVRVFVRVLVHANFCVSFRRV